MGMTIMLFLSLHTSLGSMPSGLAFRVAPNPAPRRRRPPAGHGPCRFSAQQAASAGTRPGRRAATPAYPGRRRAAARSRASQVRRAPQDTGRARARRAARLHRVLVRRAGDRQQRGQAVDVRRDAADRGGLHRCVGLGRRRRRAAGAATAAAHAGPGAAALHQRDPHVQRLRIRAVSAWTKVSPLARVPLSCTDAAPAATAHASPPARLPR